MCEASLEPVELLRYKFPYEVSEDPNATPVVRYVPAPVSSSPGFPVPPFLPGITSVNVGPQDAGLSKKEMTEILNSILPPVEWEEADGKKWRKEILDTPASRQDATALTQNLTMALRQRQARANGICPIRRQLFSKVFDELIRHVTINNAERGLLLLRIRDEIRMTLSAHQRLFDNGFAYGTRKANLVTDDYGDLETEFVDIAQDKANLEIRFQELTIAIEHLGRKQSETREVDEKRATEEIQFLKRANHQLRAQLEGIQGVKKS